jgi:hypothetical protein
MNGFTENRAHGASEMPGRNDRMMTWGATHAMLPLVERIVADLVDHHQRLSLLQLEQQELDRQRRALAWPERSRRYEIQEERTVLERELRAICAELDSLGLTVLHGPSGLIGFPTIVNDQRAFFSWRPGEADVQFWCYAGNPERHPVPSAWTRPAEERPRRGKARK